VSQIALFFSAVVAAGAVAAIAYGRFATRHGRRQSDLAMHQHHNLRAPEWGDPDLEESDAAYTVSLPLLSDTPLDSVRLHVLVDRGQTAGVVVEGGDEGAPAGLEQGEAATWRVRVDPHGDPTTKARVTATADNHEWSVLIDLPFSTYQWHGVTII